MALIQAKYSWLYNQGNMKVTCALKPRERELVLKLKSQKKFFLNDVDARFLGPKYPKCAKYPKMRILAVFSTYNTDSVLYAYIRS